MFPNITHCSFNSLVKIHITEKSQKLQESDFSHQQPMMKPHKLTFLVWPVERLLSWQQTDRSPSATGCHRGRSSYGHQRAWRSSDWDWTDSCGWGSPEYPWPRECCTWKSRSTSSLHRTQGAPPWPPTEKKELLSKQCFRLLNKNDCLQSDTFSEQILTKLSITK